MKNVRTHLYRQPKLVFRLQVLYNFINIVISQPYQKKPARNIKMLCRNHKYCILFYRYEWSSMKNVRIHLYRPPRLVFCSKILYILNNIVISWSNEKKSALNTEVLCRKCKYCILFYGYEWSSMKNIRIHLYQASRIVYR